MMNMKNPNEDYNLKLQLTQELERAVHGQKLNQELYDYLVSMIQYVFEYAKDHNVEIPKPTHLIYSLEKIHALMDSVNANHLKSVNRKLTGGNINREDNRICFVVL